MDGLRDGGMWAQKSALRITRIRLKNWRSLLGADLALGRRVLVAGPASSGKTNLLDAFRFLAESACPGLGFQRAVAARGGLSRLRCLAARQDSELGLAVQVGDQQNPALWEYELYFNQQDRRPAEIHRERLAYLGEDIVDRPDEADRKHSERLAHCSLEPLLRPRQASEFADFLGTIRYLNPAPPVLRKSDCFREPWLEPFGAGFLDQVLAVSEKTRQARLDAILEGIEKVFPQFRKFEAFRDASGRPHLRARLAQWRPPGAWQNEDVLPDGVLRLIAVFWAALETGGPLLLEEPETSLHSQAVRLVPQALNRLVRRSRRQLIMTTHSLDLMCGPGVETGEIILLSSTEEGTLARPLLDLAEAAELLDRGRRAVQPVAEQTARQMGLF